ncbi:hypothetical protein GOBAR_AA36306 [Gossypium barbadense]|uniref:adenine phosphoribosyltransferase n=1 Tax=Gossypium barbadense TaxID=3634 RepID=A0A2P5VZY3_GOSBA|nr:hypothetical protein GOBAR_AA36306 [Gossypium barbadense]
MSLDIPVDFGRGSIEARGFIFGPPIALAIGAKFVPMRKPNKLPGEVLSEEYSLEYGKDTMEMHVDAVKAGERALIIDDLVATGGTLSAAIRLLECVGVHVVECACVIELPELKMQQGDIQVPMNGHEFHYRYEDLDKEDCFLGFVFEK